MLLVMAAFGQGHLAAPSLTSEVQVIVTEVNGAVIPRAEVVFKVGSDTITTQTAQDGSIHLKLPSGLYVVTTHKNGFKTTKIVGLRVQPPAPTLLNVVLVIGDPIIFMGPPNGPFLEVPTQASNLPNQLTDDAASPEDTKDIPAAGYVPDSVTAIKIAEAVMGGLYGQKKTRSLRPFTATLDDGVWIVMRRCKSWCVGINSIVKVSKQDGRILSARSTYLK